MQFKNLYPLLIKKLTWLKRFKGSNAKLNYNFQKENKT